MTVADFTFYLFAISVVVGGLAHGHGRNPVHSVLWLILPSCLRRGCSCCWARNSSRCC
jgi:NADH:ubiquinone oxidoreductase subunit 6 (subunit J)